MPSIETEAIDLTYVIIGVAILAVFITVAIIEKDVIFGLFDVKLSARHVRY